MRSLIISTIVFTLGMASSAMATGSYGSLDLGYLGRPVPSMGNGGRFDYDIANESSLSLPAGWDLNRYDSPSAVMPGGQDGVDDLFTFCIETNQFVPGNSSSNTFMVDPEAIGGTLDRLGDYYYSLAVQPGNFVEAGAFQLATWETVFGNSDMTDGFISSGSYTSAAINLATTWLASVTGSNPLPDLLDTRMISLTNASFQDQVTQITAVPEAAALIVWTFVGGAIGLVVYRRHILVQSAENSPLN